MSVPKRFKKKQQKLVKVQNLRVRVRVVVPYNQYLQKFSM